MAPLARHKPRRKRKPLPATQQRKLSPIEKLTAAPMALIRKPHQARRLPARWMPRMLTLSLKNSKTITTLPFESFRLPWSRIALPTDIALSRNCLRRNGALEEVERAWNDSSLSLRPGHSPGWCSPSGIWRSKWRLSYRPTVLKRLSLVEMLKHKAPLLKEWPCIWDNTWPHILLKLSQDFSSEFFLIQRKDWSTKRMLLYSLRSSGRRPYTRSYCMLPAGSEQFGKRNSRDHPMGWSKLSVSPTMEQPSRDMVARKTLMRVSRAWLDWAVESTPCSFGSLPHGCLLSLMLSVIEPWCTLKGLVSGALPEITGTREFSFKIKRWQVDKSGCCPILQSRVNVDWFTFDPQIFTPLFSRLYDGILYDVFIQKASVAWHNAPNSRIMVSLLLPGTMGADEWLYKVRADRHMWPLQMTSHPAADQLPTELFMRRERRRLQVHHIWMEIKPKWHKIKERIWTKHATGLPCMTLYRRLFLNEFTGGVSMAGGPI